MKKFSNQTVETDNYEYIFIDFETANHQKTSACQIALVKVLQGKIIKQFTSLIKPYPFLFTLSHIHKISEKDVKNSKSFKELWNDIVDFFSEESIIIAHNAGFDINVLRALLEHYKIECPNFYYICSVNIFRKTQIYSSNSLKNLANLNQISFSHHDALSDVLTLQKLINIHFGENYHLKTFCNNKNIKINKLYK